MRRNKRGPGRPVSTGSADNLPIRYRITDEQLAELQAEAKRLSKRGHKVSVHQVAKLRAFPSG